MSNDPLGNFDDLLDLDIQDHVIEVMKDWCTSTHSIINASRAGLVETQISKPLNFWIDGILKGEAAGNQHAIESAKQFAIKADNIVYILRYKPRPLYPEHVALLNDAWPDFQRSMVYSLHIRNRILERTIANQPDLSAAVNEEIKKRIEIEIEIETKIKEERKKDAISKWQESGAADARKYDEADRVKWRTACKQILKLDVKIKSVRSLARKIQEKMGYPYEAIETIRKDIEIKKMSEEHGIKSNFG